MLAGESWDAVGFDQARSAAAAAGGYSSEFDLATYFLHDLPAPLIEELGRRSASQLDERFDDRCMFDAWPAVPIHLVAGRDDRFFPLELQRRVARDRLGVDVTVVPGGHLAALSHPEPLTDVIAGVCAAQR